MTILQCSSRFQYQRITPTDALYACRTFLQSKSPSQHPFIVLPFTTIPIGGGKSQPLLRSRCFHTLKDFQVPDLPAKSVLLSSGKGKADITSLHLAKIDHRAACQTIIPLISENRPMLAIDRSFN